MKLKQTIVSVIVIAAGLTSCQKDLYDPSQNQPEIKVEDLKIADDFGWTMTQSSKCTIQSDPHNCWGERNNHYFLS